MASIPLSHQKQWYEIRDLFLGQNYVSRDIPRALSLVAACEHPDARWLASVCAGKDVKDGHQAGDVFFALGENDARALCFAWYFGPLLSKRFPLLLRSAELGYAFAQACVAGYMKGEEKFKLAQLAASQGEREAFSTLACCFGGGHGCVRDSEKAKQNFLMAAELGSVFSLGWVGHLLSDEDRWRCWSRAAKCGWSEFFLEGFSEQVKKFNSGSGSASVVFQIGWALKGNVYVRERRFFKNGYRQYDFRFAPAIRAIRFYEAQIKACQDAVHAWTQVGIRLKVARDIRNFIGKMIWKSRDEANYGIPQSKLSCSLQ